ncbi:MAG: GNAT family N-acetyltransferase, partial [Verrucomicrobiota bacterium]
MDALRLSLPLLASPLFPARPVARATKTALAIEIVNPLTDPTWDSDVARHPAATSFHTSAWARVLHTTYQHRPSYLRATRDGELIGLFPLMEVETTFTPRRGICLPFSDYCGPLLFRSDAASEVIDAAIRLGRQRQWRYLQIRDSSVPGNGSPASAIYYGHELDLRDGPEAVFARFASSVQRAIRKAERSEVEVEISQEAAAMREFVSLHHQTRRRHGVPPQPDGFFSAIQEQMLQSGGGFIAIARRRSQPLAAAVFFRSGKQATYKFAASDRNSQELRANNLVIWRAIEHLASSDVQRLH